MFRAAFCRPQELEQQQPGQARDVAEHDSASQAAALSAVNLALGGKGKKVVENKRPSGLNVQPVATQESSGSSSNNNQGKRNKKKAASGEEKVEKTEEDTLNGNEAVRAPVEQVSAVASTESASQQAKTSKKSWADEMEAEERGEAAAGAASAGDSDISIAQHPVQDQTQQQQQQQQQQEQEQQEEQVNVQHDQPSAAVSAREEGVIPNGAPMPSEMRRHSSPSNICSVEMMPQGPPHSIYPSYPYPPQFNQAPHPMFYPQGHPYPYPPPHYPYAYPQPVFHQPPPPQQQHQQQQQQHQQQQEQEHCSQAPLFNPDAQPPMQYYYPIPANYPPAYGLPGQPTMPYGYMMPPQYYQHMMMLQNYHAMMSQQQQYQMLSPPASQRFDADADLTEAYHVKDSKNNEYLAHWRYTKEQVDKLVETLNKYADPNPLLQQEKDASGLPPNIDESTVLNSLVNKMGAELFYEFANTLDKWRSRLGQIWPRIEKKAHTIKRATMTSPLFANSLPSEGDEYFVTVVSPPEHFRQIEEVQVRQRQKAAARQARANRQQQQHYSIPPMMVNPNGIPIAAQ